MGAAAPEIQKQIAEMEDALEKAGCANTSKDYLKAITVKGLENCKIGGGPAAKKAFGDRVAMLRSKLGPDAMVLDGLLKADALLEGLNQGASAFGRQSGGRYSRSVASSRKIKRSTKKMLSDLGSKQVPEVAEGISTKAGALKTKCAAIVARCTARKANIEAAFKAVPV